MVKVKDFKMRVELGLSRWSQSNHMGLYVQRTFLAVVRKRCDDRRRVRDVTLLALKMEKGEKKKKKKMEKGGQEPMDVVASRGWKCQEAILLCGLQK